jgi:hypothetical protein
MDMSEAEVMRLLGPPANRRPGTATGTSIANGRSYETCVWYAKGGGILQLTFTSDGRIVAKSTNISPSRRRGG